MSWLNTHKPIIALAPLADLTDGPFSRICREVAGHDFIIFREMVSAEAIVRQNEKTLRMCAFTPEERPMVIQIFGGDPVVMRKAAQIVIDKFNPDGLDINMGCPVPKLTGKSKSGAYLMKDAELAEEIVRQVKTVVTDIPLSVKTRLGWSKPDEILAFAPRLEAAGADAITIHGRTKTQGYAGEADWSAIAKVRNIVSIPIIANGDVQSYDDISKCLAATGADGVMIGRGALGNPWIFVNREPDINEIKAVVWKHAEAHLAHYGEEYGLQTFRKHLLFYFKGIPDIKKTRAELARVSTLSELKEVLKGI